jgi:osmotically-inducible protein OsmY
MARKRTALVALVAGIQAGYAFSYYLDPEAGRRRRAQLRDRAGKASRRTARATARLARRAGSELGGQVARLLHPRPSEVDDLTLLDRVESALFGEPEIPKGAISLEVRDRVVVLRGELPPVEIDRVHEAVLRIPGVEGVDDLFHLPGTPAPNKAAALRASRSGG